MAAVKSAMNAMFANRVGDFFLTLGFFSLFYTFGTLDYSTIFSLVPNMNTNVITFISLLLLLGAAAKSAQIGLMKALISLNDIRTLIYAETISINLKIEKDKEVNSKNFHKQGEIYQQERNELKLGKKDILYNREFLDWFIGFGEGDGSFYIIGGKSIFSIHLHIAELDLLYEIKKQLNKGSVGISKKSNSVIYVVKGKRDVENLINIFNVNIFIKNKQAQFEKLVLNYNDKYKRNIDIKVSNFNPSLNDA